jgi:hypothetical protein
LSRLYLGRFSDVHIGGPSSNQATSLESQMIHPTQLLPGRTLRGDDEQTVGAFLLGLPGKLDGMSRRIRARPGNHWHTPVSGLGRDTDEATVFDHTQRRRFAGSTGDDERGDALSNLPFTEASKGLFVNAVALERCRQCRSVSGQGGKTKMALHARR